MSKQEAALKHAYIEALTLYRKSMHEGRKHRESNHLHLHMTDGPEHEAAVTESKRLKDEEEVLREKSNLAYRYYAAYQPTTEKDGDE